MRFFHAFYILLLRKKMSQEENVTKVTKIILRILNKNLRELSVTKIRKSKSFGNLKPQTAERDHLKIHLIK